MNRLQTRHGDLLLPAFLPDATRGIVRTLDARDLEACGIRGLVVNTVHLSSRPGISLVAGLGGIHRFMGWERPVVSDSGGFQVLSLVSESPKTGGVGKDGFAYRLGGEGKKHLTPEKCVQKQFRLGADVMFCLDHCTHPGEAADRQRESVTHTVAWARRCKQEFLRRLDQRPPAGDRPLLFAVVQGGEDRDLRRRCAEDLAEIGFDGYGFGGWPIDPEGRLLDTVGYVADLLPGDSPRHALGVGKPENLVRAHAMGYDLFDCAIPTRDARRERLYTFTRRTDLAGDDDPFYRYLYLADEKMGRDPRPVDEGCPCLCCRRYTRAYLHHLFRIRDGLAYRLATLHNLTFYSEMIGLLRSARGEGAV